MTEAGKVETTEVREAHRLDEKALATYLGDTVDGFSGAMEVRQFPSGQSNPTFQIISGNKKYVLRKKPPGKLLPSAHAIDREYKIISALQASDVPVPRAQHYCEDASVIGTEFYLMEMIEGRVFHDPTLPGVTPEERREFYDDFIRVLASLHAINAEAVRLGDFGRANGYMERQVSRWSKQYEASKTEEIPAMDEVIAWLPANMPDDPSVSVVHGDYRPGNTVVFPDKAKVAAVLDWELATLGHPLADLGYCCTGYHGDPTLPGSLSGLDCKAMGIPTEEEFVERYCHYSGRGNIDNFHYYVIFSIFRSAAIVQGVYKRGLDGNASSEKALTYGEIAKERAQTAWALVEKHF